MKIFAIAAAALVVATAAQASTIKPSSYSMQNGNSGSYNYWDDSYTGAGNKTQDNAFLSGGVGDLTDGVIATQNWNTVEPPRGANGPYVGWAINPVISFFFDKVYKFNSITFHFDDSNGLGGVSAPRSVTVNGIGSAVADPASGAPFAHTQSLSQLASTNTLLVQINRNAGWVFLSEVEFDAQISAVPLPASGLLLLGGIGGLVALRRRKAKA